MVNISCVFPILLLRSWTIFTITILNSLSGRLHISISCSCFPRALSCPFISDIILCLSFWITYCDVVSVLTAEEVMFFFLLLSALWWIRLWGLCKLSNGTDWQLEKLGLALVGRALFSKTLIKLSADGWGLSSLPVSCLAWGSPVLESTGSMVRLMVTSKRAYTKGHLPGLLLPVPPSQGEPLVVHASDRDPPTLAGRFGSVSCGVTAPFSWVLVHARFCLWLPRAQSLFLPVLWKSCSQIPLAFKVRFHDDS